MEVLAVGAGCSAGASVLLALGGREEDPKSLLTCLSSQNGELHERSCLKK